MDATTPFERALEFTLLREGGFVNHPADPGGATNMGVTQATYNAWRQQHHLTPRGVMDITRQEVAAIYRANYWRRAKCDRFSERVAVAHFDAAVHHGPRQANRLLQLAVGAADDGLIGPRTLAMVEARGEDATVRAMLDHREAFLRRLAQRRPSLNVFLNGWLNRIDALRSALQA